jgi:hypothetical protein
MNLTLQLSAEQTDAHCLAILGQTRQAGQALAALSALQAFIAATTPQDEQAGAVYPAIKAMLDRHVATARSRVMEENLALLIPALLEQNLCDIQRVHAALSRNGFHQTVLTAIRRLSDAALLAAAGWAAEWCRDATARAEAASGFPAALDLRGAGISPGMYTAMAELNIYLREVVR